MMNALRVSWLFFKVGVLNELQYRVNFVVQLFQSAIALTVGLVVLALDHALTKPADSQVLVSVREVRIWQVVDLISGSVVLGIGLTQVAEGVGAIDALAFGIALAFGAVLIYCFWLAIATVAFWVVNMWHAIELFDGLYLTGRFPVGIYPGWLRYSVTFLVPIAFAVTVPAEAVTSRLDWQTMLVAA